MFLFLSRVLICGEKKIQVTFVLLTYFATIVFFSINLIILYFILNNKSTSNPKMIDLQIYINLGTHWSLKENINMTLQ